MLQEMSQAEMTSLDGGVTKTQAVVCTIGGAVFGFLWGGPFGSGATVIACMGIVESKT